MNKYLVLKDGTRIPIDDTSSHSSAICYPDSMSQVEDWWGKLTPDTIAKQVYFDGETERVIFEDPTLHFNKIELEYYSLGVLMRIVFASDLEEEIQRLMAENETLREDSIAYHIMRDGGAA